MAHDAITFIEAIGVDQVDVLGFSIGSFAAQEMGLIRPALMRNLVLASAAPKGAAGMHGWAHDVIDAVGQPQPNPEGYLRCSSRRRRKSQRAGREALGRMISRTSDRDEPTSWQTRQAQYDAVCVWGEPNHALLERLRAIRPPGLRGQRRQRSDDPPALLVTCSPD